MFGKTIRFTGLAPFKKKEREYNYDCALKKN